MATSSLGAWKRRAIRQARVSRKETLAFIKRLSREEMLEPRTQDRWSVKDVLGHFMACDEETVRRLRHIAAGHAERIKWFESMAYADRFNARTVASARRLSLAAVLRRMARARGDLVKRLQRLPPAAYRDPAHAYPMTEWLPAPGWSHEREHMAEVKAWWRHAGRRGE
ncbi:MAG TPA: DinB family protein [Methylomirabilota bacterium]|nr:DinB family protein [Methylomirabilota bacterium]